jgi:hypothetical protein
MAPTSDEPKLKHAGELFPIASVSAPGRPEYRIALGLTSAARGLLGTFNPTLVHIATPDVLGFQAQAWAREMRVPVVCSYHTHFAQVTQPDLRHIWPPYGVYCTVGQKRPVPQALMGKALTRESCLRLRGQTP